ncbi:O-antigen ligase family protein [Rhodobacter sp. TJ_12]|uniref:O-antigen ligase family protein n=1 Tax=Rhodobacter sp. TJ_12 TaxID=2029399 RepID=UPI001CBD5111|nr:O-antigen ligase family protein [Rhodobacter sp. TJ_12]
MIATERLLVWLISLVICLLFFGNHASLGRELQLAALGLLGATAALALIQGKIRQKPLGLNEWVLVSLSLISFLSSMLNNLPYSMQYTVLFTVSITAMIALSRAVRFQELFEMVALSFAVMVGLSILSDPLNYMVGLSAETITGVGLLRYTAFDLHPNLAGFIYGGGTIILWVRALHLTGLKRKLYFLFAALSFSLVLAASSRAGMVATIGAFASVGLSRLFPLSRRKARLLGLVLTATVLALVFTDLGAKVAGYIIKVSDLQSSTRGLTSGGSGRTDLWLQGLELIANRDFLLALFGTGLRSSEVGTIGFSTESSYITVLIENGLLPGTVALVLLLFSMPYYLLRARKGHSDDMLIAMLLTFGLLESIFNRYLFAIGNPLSLYYLFIYGALLRKTYPSPPGAPERAASAHLC